MPNANNKITFANKVRTTCVAFTALAARFYQKNITDENITMLISAPTSSDVYKMLRNLDDMKFLLPIKLYTDAYDAVLDKLFETFIYNGTNIYSDARESSSKVTETNFFKDDKNYYKILKRKWRTIKPEINKIFANI